LQLKAFFEDPELQKFFLVFIRLSGLMVFAPPFMNRRLSTQFKGGLTFFLTVIIAPGILIHNVVIPYHFIDLSIAIGGELLIGLIIGFSVRLLFTTYELAGEFIDKQIGFAMASLVDPTTDVTVSILGSLFMNLALFLFMDYGGHLWVIQTLAGSFQTLPLLEGDFHQQGLIYHMNEIFVHCFATALSISLPVVSVVTLIYVAQGFLQRTMPQFQIFAVGFIFTITVGLTSVQLVLANFRPISEDLFDDVQQQVWFLISNLSQHGR
jgi:flagellar biosynthetic protein FliR